MLDQSIKARHNYFTEQNEDELDKLLLHVANLADIEWEYTDTVLRVFGLAPDTDYIEIGHPRAARAFLEAWLMGYNTGFKDGRDS